MPDLDTDINFLADIPLYETEKPYYVLPLAGGEINPNEDKVTNIQLEPVRVHITDLRSSPATLEENGFCVAKHTSEQLDIRTKEDLASYKRETEQFLRGIYEDAVYVQTWDFRRRKNQKNPIEVFDMNDQLLVEAPAVGAHVDATADSGPVIVERYLPPEARQRYLKPGYRFRLVNTWRTLNQALEDRPLAVCDFKSVEPEDLIPCDRVYPLYVGEVYNLRYNSNQRWHWISKQTPEELFVMVMYDTAMGTHARFCPHVSIENPLASPNASPRESIETRSIIVSKAEV